LSFKESVYRRVNMVEIFCTFVYKLKNETIPGMEKKGIKENNGEGELNFCKYNIPSVQQ
jgi:hypothetical protein